MAAKKKAIRRIHRRIITKKTPAKTTTSKVAGAAGRVVNKAAKAAVGPRGTAIVERAARSAGRWAGTPKKATKNTIAKKYTPLPKSKRKPYTLLKKAPRKGKK